MTIDKTKFARVCGLLSSDFEGERATAALMATRMLKDAGLTWHDLFSVILADDESKNSSQQGEKSSVHGKAEASDVIKKCMQLLDDCQSDWDETYIINLDNLRKRFKGHVNLTSKQWYQLLRIAKELGVVI